MAKVIVDRTIPDLQKAEAQAEIEQALTAREAAITAALTGQNAINLTEAQGNDRFSSRWRSAAGWVCVLGLAYQYVFAQIVTWAGALVGTVLGFPSRRRPRW
ncbi:3TM-type holin [Methylobacterium sp.]|uniref:3TM-type holin n=1 Tax=Methylobacterium sp. TaxID=409 RepID=UPI0025808C36|nr:3TM-type holin [Methylobacterium sp.]